MMESIPRSTRFRRLAGMGASMLLATGCRMLEPAPIFAHQAPQPAPDPLTAEVQALREWRQEVRLNQEQAARDIESLRSRLDALEAALREQQQATETRFHDSDAARAQDREWVVAELARKLTEIQKTLTPPPPPVPARGSGYEHLVKSGETLSEIARAYGVKIEAILKANGLRDANTIRVGQKLFIPD